MPKVRAQSDTESSARCWSAASNGGHVEVLTAQSGEIRLGKAHDHRAFR